MKPNLGKFQFMILGKKQCNKVKLKVHSIVINESDTVELLGITNYNKLFFNEYINNLCRNASALRRIRKYLTQHQATLLCNAFINNQFRYAPIIWVLSKIHHKELEAVFNDELLQISNEIIIHQKHLHALICKVFKSLNNSNPEFMWSYFTFKNITYNIRNGPLLKLHDAKSTYYGINSIHFRACLLWNGLPQSIKHSESILELYRKLK